MDTKLLTTAEDDLKIAADILKNGGNVIIPTETVYGLGADAMNPTAVKNIFKAKGRPADNPLIVHIASFDMLDKIAENIPDSAKALSAKFWPGPLTVILNKCKNVPYETTGGLDTVAIRMPRCEATKRVIELSGVAVAAPSANLSGKPSPTTFRHCVDDMMGRVDAIVDGGDCEIGVESTVIDLSGDKPILLRPGGITYEQLKEVLGEVEIVTSVKDGEKPKSPGLKYKHYSPEAEVIILSGSAGDVVSYVEKQAKTEKTGVLVFDEFPKFNGAVSISLGSVKNPKNAAHRLFTALRDMDKAGVSKVYAPEIGTKGEWRAVRNRLYRAAGGRILSLSDNDSERRNNRGADKKYVLFVCTGNTCRSPMASAMFNDICKKKNIAAVSDSAGIFADGSAASDNAAAAMREIGLDISGQASKRLTAEMIDSADLVLTMSQGHKSAIKSAFGGGEKVKTLCEYAGEDGDVSDPFGGSIDEYRRCRDMLKGLVSKAAEKL